MKQTISAARLLLALGLLPITAAGQQEPTTLDTLRVQVVSRLDPGLPASTRSIELFSRERISTMPVQTVADLLDWATGVDVRRRSAAQSDLSVRGASFEQVVVLVNGIRMSHPQTGHFDLDLAVPLEAIERVEILRGAAAALHGADAMGGVVNIVTHSGEAPLEASLQGGSWGTLRVAAGGGIDHAGAEGIAVNVGAAASRSDGHRDGTDYRNMLFHLSLSSPVRFGELSGEVGASRRDFGAQDFYAPYPSFEKTRNYTAALGWSSNTESPLFWEIRLSARRHDDQFVLVRDDPSLFRNQHTSYQSGGTLLGRYVGGKVTKVAFGSEVYWEHLNGSGLGDRTQRRGALFGEALFGSPAAAVVSMGGRVDWHQGFGVVFSPSLSGSVLAYRGLRLRGALGGSYRVPTWTERYYEDPVHKGRADLKPERAWNAETGVDMVFGHGIRASTTAFVRRANSLIDWARPLTAENTEPWETRNVQKATFGGVEAEVEVDGPFGVGFTASGTAISVTAEDAEGFRSKYALRPLTEQLTLEATRAIGALCRGSLRLRHAGREAEDSYRTVDLRFALWITRGWLFVDALNITDFDYQDVTGARAPGRAVFLGFRTVGSR